MVQFVKSLALYTYDLEEMQNVPGNKLEENLVYAEIWWLQKTFSEHHLQLNLGLR